MGINPVPNNFLSVEIQSGDSESRIEQIPAAGNGTRSIRLSIRRDGQPLSGYVDLAEKELVVLLARAIRAGVVSPDFIRALRAEFEI